MKSPSEREIFLEALERPTPEARTDYLQTACGGNDVLRRKVEELLEEHYSDDSLLAGSALKGERDPEAGPPAWEAPGRRIGRYQLREKLGEGGFGEVWDAEQCEPVKRRVALKILKPGMDSRQIVARFEAERQALALMDHANIARIFDAGVSDTGRPYFVMELVQGIRITEYCDKHQLATRERLNLFIQVCQAIQHAHQKGIIHRDIKPSNILVTVHDGVSVPKVIDFGIAKATQQELTDKTVFTQLQQFIGTPAYISPEQAEMSGQDVDTRADIYSLGVLLYELLVGETPFDVKEMLRSGFDGLRQIIREREPLRPSTRLNTLACEARTTVGERRQTEVGKLVHQLRGDLDWIVMKCLEKDRARRYDTANGLAMDIQRHLSCEPVLARPPSQLYEFQKTVRRHQFGFAAAAAIIVVLAAGVALTTWQAVRATRATKAEYQQRLAAQAAQVQAQANQREAEEERQRVRVQSQRALENELRSRRFLYVSDISLAQQALKRNNLGKARSLLDRHQPEPGEEDLRGWEWRYLWQLTRGNAPVTLTNRPTQGFSVSFAPDGRRLAVGWWDGRVDLWDVDARQWIRALTDRELPHPARVAFSPVRNLLAATSGPGAVTLYDLDSGGESILWQVTDPGGWDVRDLVFSHDGSRVVVYAGSNPAAGDAVWVVEVASSRIEDRLPAGRSPTGWAHLGAARISPDNRRLYLTFSGDWKGTIQCIELGTNRKIWEIPRQEELLLSLDISPDGRVLASAAGFLDTTIHLWDAATGKPLVPPLAGHTASVIDVAFTKDGRRLVSAGDDQTIRFWDTGTWTEQQALRGHTDGAWAVAISEAARLLASTGKDGRFLLWNMDEKRAADGYRLLPGNLAEKEVHSLDHSRVLLLPRGQPPEVVDLVLDSAPVPLQGIRSSDHILGCLDTNLLCVWDVINDRRGTNLLGNGSFSNGLAGWVTEQHNNARASFTSTFDFGSNQPSAKITVTNADAAGWSIQLNHPRLKLASNLVYTLSFAAKATPATGADVAVNQAHPDWLGLGCYRSLSLTTNWQWFTNTFQPPAGDTDARVNFGSMGDKLGTFWFADVRLEAGTNQASQMLVGSLRGTEFVPREAIALDAGVRPTGVAYDSARRVLAWSEGTSSRALHVASLGSSHGAGDRRLELTSDVPGLVPFRFSEGGNYLVAVREPDILRTWNVDTGQIVASINQNPSDASRSRGWQDLACFAAKGRVLVVAVLHAIRNEILFFDLARPDLPPRRVPGGFFEQRLAVSPNGEWVAASSFDATMQLFDAARGELRDSLHGHLNAAFEIAFSPDGRRLITTKNGQATVQVWDLDTGQELLTLAGAEPFPNKVFWSADGNVILAGQPWQAWIAPSWEEIDAAEAKDPPSAGFGGRGGAKYRRR